MPSAALRYGKVVAAVGSLVVLLAVGATLALLGAAGETSEAEPVVESARGVVLNVESASILRVDAITILTADGRHVRFAVDESTDLGGFTASHLRSHGLEGDPVTVNFKNEGDELVAVRLTD